jgi:hypothetical protein
MISSSEQLFFLFFGRSFELGGRVDRESSSR